MVKIQEESYRQHDKQNTNLPERRLRPDDNAQFGPDQPEYGQNGEGDGKR
jgi:hypothetical protein